MPKDWQQLHRLFSTSGILFLANPLKDVYLMVKRIADILEKFAVGSLLVGFYQGNYMAVSIAVLTGAGCLYLTHRGKQ